MKNNIDLYNQKLIQQFLELKKNCQISKSEENRIYQSFVPINPFNYPFFNNYTNNKRKEGESNNNIQLSNNKKAKCKTFYEKGYCPLGSKCKFQHDERKYKDINFSYFYIRLFLLKNFGFPKSNYNYKEKNSCLYNKRLEVFESLTSDSYNKDNDYENEKYDSSCDNFDNPDIIINFN